MFKNTEYKDSYMVIEQNLNDIFFSYYKSLDHNEITVPVDEYIIMVNVEFENLFKNLFISNITLNLYFDDMELNKKYIHKIIDSINLLLRIKSDKPVNDNIFVFDSEKSSYILNDYWFYIKSNELIFKNIKYEDIDFFMDMSDIFNILYKTIMIDKNIYNSINHCCSILTEILVNRKSKNRILYV